MCEILRSNFEAKFQEIEDAIKNSMFVAIDTEFTGLSLNDSTVASLFDDGSTRYKKLRKSVSQFVISQFGLCAFVINPEEPNRYKAVAYNFYLFQPSFGPVDCRFLSQASSLEFLCQNKFDFNKFTYEGVPYLNKEEEEAIRGQHDDQTLHCNLPSYKLGELDAEIKDEIAKLESWLETAEEGNIITLHSENNYFKQYMILNELKNHFGLNKVSYKVQDSFKIDIIKENKDNVNNSQKKQNKTKFTEEVERIFLKVIGFTRVIRTLIKHKKPIIGHNLLTDLLLVYDKFISPLPESYNEFKEEFTKTFAAVYDTKHLAFKIRKQKALDDCTFLDNTNLDELHTRLTSDEARFFVLYNPSIELAEISQRYGEDKYLHEAGYDAYLSGYVFLRVAHLYAAKSHGSQLSRHFPFSKYLKAVRPYVNHVNLPRASIQYLNLGGDDPPSVRPQWFTVESRGTSSLSGPEVAKQFLRFGSVDVKIIDRCHALVAVSHHRRVKDVLSLVKKSKKITVRLYNPLYDSPIMKTIIWSGGAILTTTLFVGTGVLIWKILQ